MGAYPLDSTYRLGGIGVAKMLEDANAVELDGKVVSGVDGGTVYLQEPGRFSGIAVKGLSGYQPGDVVASVIGALSTDISGGRVLTASSASAPVRGHFTLAPLGSGLSCGTGLTGVYVRAWGQVQQLTSNGFTLYDGKSASQVRYSSASFDAGDYVMVTGARTNNGSIAAGSVTRL